MVRQIETLAEFQKEVLDARDDKLIVVDFWATWCGPCIRIAPILATIAEENPGILVLKVDIDQNKDTSEAQEIQCMPTFKFFKNGECKHTLEGASEKDLRDSIAKYQ